MRPRSRDDRALLSKLQGAAIAHVLREFESPEFNDVMSREFDRRHEVLTERLVARDEEAAKLTTDFNETRTTLARVEEEKRTVEERLKHTEDALAAANATIAALKEEAARVAAEAEAAESSD
jgi:chromosome segregation ATPase